MLHVTDLLDISFSLFLQFWPVLSLETSVCSILKFCPVSSGFIMGIRSSFLFVSQLRVIFKMLWLSSLYCRCCMDKYPCQDFAYIILRLGHSINIRAMVFQETNQRVSFLSALFVISMFYLNHQVSTVWRCWACQCYFIFIHAKGKGQRKVCFF